MSVLTKEQKEVLARARRTYGSRNQLAIAAEELNELAIAILKFMRYDSEGIGVTQTQSKVLEERADVEIILNHIDSIYNFDEEKIKLAAWGKIERLQNWLNTTDDLAYSMEERHLPAYKSKDCNKCFYYNHPEEAFESEICKSCKS